MAPLLFRSLKNGDRKIEGREAERLHVDYCFGNTRIIFSGPELLGVDDLRVLQALVAMSGPSEQILNSEPKSEVGIKLREGLQLTGAALFDNAIVVNGSYRVLAQEIGYESEGGKVFQGIRSSIKRLSDVSIISEVGECRKGFQMLSEYLSRDAEGHLHVALNPRITEAVMPRGRHARIDMHEVRGLSTDPARLLHQRLCGWIDPGGRRAVILDTLCKYIWPESTKSSTLRQRRMRVRAALEEFKIVGWRVKEYEPSKFLVIRP